MEEEPPGTPKRVVPSKERVNTVRLPRAPIPPQTESTRTIRPLAATNSLTDPKDVSASPNISTTKFVLAAPIITTTTTTTTTTTLTTTVSVPKSKSLTRSISANASALETLGANSNKRHAGVIDYQNLQDPESGTMEESATITPMPRSLLSPQSPRRVLERKNMYDIAVANDLDSKSFDNKLVLEPFTFGKKQEVIDASDVRKEGSLLNERSCSLPESDDETTNTLVDVGEGKTSGRISVELNALNLEMQAALTSISSKNSSAQLSPNHVRTREDRLLKQSTTPVLPRRERNVSNTPVYVRNPAPATPATTTPVTGKYNPVISGGIPVIPTSTINSRTVIPISSPPPAKLNTANSVQFGTNTSSNPSYPVNKPIPSVHSASSSSNLSALISTPTPTSKQIPPIPTQATSTKQIPPIPASSSTTSTTSPLSPKPLPSIPANSFTSPAGPNTANISEEDKDKEKESYKWKVHFGRSGKKQLQKLITSGREVTLDLLDPEKIATLLSWAKDSTCETSLREASIACLIQFCFPNESVQGLLAKLINEQTVPLIVALARNQTIAVHVTIPKENITIEKEIAKGGAGIVYSGTWNNKKVAIKVCSNMSLCFSPTEFWGEVSIMSLIQHPSLLPCWGACVDKENYYMVMPLFDCSLQQLLADRTVELNYAQKLRMASEVAIAVSTIHCYGILHRDLKTANILVRKHENIPTDSVSRYRLAVADFGTARGINKKDRFTRDVGTAAYSAPEVFSQDDSDDFYTTKVDVYSLGVVIWCILTRQIPFEQEKSHSVPHLVLEGARPPLTDTTIFSPHLQALIKSCWQSNPVLRPTSNEVFNHLQEIERSYKSNRG